MSNAQRVKIGDYVINLAQITNVIRYEDGQVKVYFSGDSPLTMTPGDSSEAFWRFYTSYLYGCVDVMELFARKPEVTLSAEVENYREAF